MSDAAPSELERYLERPLTPPDAATLAAIESGPLPVEQALALDDVERLLDPTPVPAETGWCTLPDGVGYVAVRTAMPDVSGEMVDWWFDWHPHYAECYRAWHPLAHFDNSVDPPGGARGAASGKPHWERVHHPVEDVGMGVVHARIVFHAPSRMGFSGDLLDDPRVATVVCGYAGDDTRRVRHTPMYHVFLRAEQGIVLRSRFWLGAALRPYGPLGGAGELLLNRSALRRRLIPRRLPQALARHCAEEYANLAAVLPELYASFGPHG